jgi:hypothetical protein
MSLDWKPVTSVSVNMAVVALWRVWSPRTIKCINEHILEQEHVIASLLYQGYALCKLVSASQARWHSQMRAETNADFGFTSLKPLHSVC